MSDLSKIGTMQGTIVGILGSLYTYELSLLGYTLPTGSLFISAISGDKEYHQANVRAYQNTTLLCTGVKGILKLPIIISEPIFVPLIVADLAIKELLVPLMPNIVSDAMQSENHQFTEYAYLNDMHFIGQSYFYE